MDQEKVVALFNARVSEVAQETGVDIPGSDFVVGLHQCWSCGQDILVFSWVGHDDEDDNKPPSGHPNTIQETFSQTVGDSYWGNTCPYCHKLQGDFYLYMEPGGPFFAADTSDGIEQAQAKVILYALELDLLNIEE